jgi:mycothiol system anti-sigma-R factor
MNVHTCHDAQARLYEYLDRELPPDEEAGVGRHLADCDWCRERFRFERLLLGTVREKCRVTTPPSLRHRIHALIGER